jgi:hypothetical protein
MSKPSWVDVWYDRHVRSWCIQVKDDEGNQVENESTYVYSKEEAKEIERRNIEYYNIDPRHSRKKQKEYREYLKSLK